MVDDAAMPSVTTQITVIVIAYAVLVTVLALVVALRRAERPPWLDSMVWMLEVLLVVRGLAGLSTVLGDDPPDSMSTHVGYLVSSVCVLPIALKSIEGDRAVWSSAVVAVAALAVAVIALRLQMTA
jgi:heme A synthase